MEKRRAMFGPQQALYIGIAVWLSQTGRICAQPASYCADLFEVESAEAPIWHQPYFLGERELLGYSPEPDYIPNVVTFHPVTERAFLTNGLSVKEYNSSTCQWSTHDLTARLSAYLAARGFQWDGDTRCQLDSPQQDHRIAFDQSGDGYLLIDTRFFRERRCHGETNAIEPCFSDTDCSEEVCASTVCHPKRCTQDLLMRCGDDDDCPGGSCRTVSCTQQEEGCVPCRCERDCGQYGRCMGRTVGTDARPCNYDLGPNAEDTCTVRRLRHMVLFHYRNEEWVPAGLLPIDYSALLQWPSGSHALPGPPAILLQNGKDLKLLVPYKEGDALRGLDCPTTLDAPNGNGDDAPDDVFNQGFGQSSFAVTVVEDTGDSGQRSVLYIVWARPECRSLDDVCKSLTDPAADCPVTDCDLIECPKGTPTYIARCEPGPTGTHPCSAGLTRAFLGHAGRAVDNHNIPGITIDTENYLHVVLGAHHDSFIYFKSREPATSSSWDFAQRDGWERPFRLGAAGLCQECDETGGCSTSCPNAGGRVFCDCGEDVAGKNSHEYTYVSLLCDRENNLHVAARWAGITCGRSGLMRLAYLRKPAGGDWEMRRDLVLPFKNNYSNWYQKLSHGPDGRLYIFYTYLADRLTHDQLDAYRAKWPEEDIVIHRNDCGCVPADQRVGGTPPLYHRAYVCECDVTSAPGCVPGRPCEPYRNGECGERDQCRVQRTEGYFCSKTLAPCDPDDDSEACGSCKHIVVSEGKTGTQCQYAMTRAHNPVLMVSVDQGLSWRVAGREDFGGCDGDPVVPTATDFDFDCDVDLDDFRLFLGCATGPDVAYDPHNLLLRGCHLAPDREFKIRPDVDRDGDVDLADFARLAAAFGGS